MAVTRGTFSALLAPDLRKVFVETGLERPVEYSAVFNGEPMEWNPITDQQISGLGTAPAMAEGQTFSLDQQIIGGTKAYTATPFGLAFEVTRAAWEDELYGIFRESASMLARASRNRKEVAAWSVLNNAFSTSFVGFTSGKSLCSITQTTLDGRTVANRPNPDVGFSITGLQNGLIRFETMTDERNLPRLMQPTMCIIAPANKFVAREILGSSNKPFTSDNEMNSLLDEDLKWMVSHYLTTSTNWFLTASKGEHDMNFFVRSEPVFDSFDDPWTGNAVFTVWQRHAQGFGTWRGIDGSTG